MKPRILSLSACISGSSPLASTLRFFGCIAYKRGLHVEESSLVLASNYVFSLVPWSVKPIESEWPPGCTLQATGVLYSSMFYSPFFTPPSRRSSSSLDLAIQFLLLSATPKPHVAWLRPSASVSGLGSRVSWHVRGRGHGPHVTWLVGHVRRGGWGPICKFDHNFTFSVSKTDHYTA